MGGEDKRALSGCKFIYDVGLSEKCLNTERGSPLSQSESDSAVLYLFFDALNEDGRCCTRGRALTTPDLCSEGERRFSASAVTYFSRSLSVLQTTCSKSTPMPYFLQNFVETSPAVEGWV